jgi:hypothetical protein
MTEAKGSFPPAAGCLLSIGIGIIGVLLVFAVLSLAFSGELTVRLGEFREFRFWTVSEGDNRGIAYSIPRFTNGSIEAGEVCLQTKVRFILWRTVEEQLNPSYCECFQRAGDIWQSLGSCPN